MQEQAGSRALTIDKVRECVYTAIDDLNASLPVENRLSRSPETVIYDGTGAADSLTVTMLIVALEQKVEETFGASITLVGEQTFWSDNGPFRSVQTLSEYILKLLNT